MMRHSRGAEFSGNFSYRVHLGLLIYLEFSAPQAAIININTGVDATQNTLNPCEIDLYWDISTDGTNFSDAKIVFPGAYPDYSSGPTCCGMETASNDPAWTSTPSIVATSPTTGWVHIIPFML